MSDLQSFLDSGTTFEGKVAFTGVVRIDGHFRGEANADGTLVVGETGTVEADLEVSSLVVHGTYRGNVHAKEVVEVGATGVVEGSVTTARLTVAEGAQVNASIHMGERRRA
jgi:cytoskeletal protein CcmA (bactofilin family)